MAWNVLMQPSIHLASRLEKPKNIPSGKNFKTVLLHNYQQFERHSAGLFAT